MNEKNILGEAPVRVLFFKYYIPALVRILSITVHQIINGIILGRQVGKEGLAAVGVYGPVVIVFIALTLPVMIGSGILIGKNIGAKDYSRVREIFRFSTTLALVAGGTVALSTPFLVKPVAEFLVGAENKVMAASVSDYVFWQFIGLPFFFLSMFWGNFVSNDGAPHVSRNASLAAVLLNILLDILLIIIFPFGVAGASLATAVSMFASVLFLFIYIQKGKGHLTFINFRPTLKLKEWKELVHFGLPSFASEISFSAGLLLISHSVVPYGVLAVSVFGLINYLSFIFLRLLTSAMVAMLPIVSFNIGARLPSRVLATLRFSLFFAGALGFIITVVGLIVPHFLVRLFSGDETQLFTVAAGRALTFYFLLFVAAGPNFILAAYFQSIGKPAISVVTNILKGAVLIVVFTTLLPGYFKMGIDGIWLSRALAEIFTLVIIGVYTLYYRSSYYSTEVILKKALK